MSDITPIASGGLCGLSLCVLFIGFWLRKREQTNARVLKESKKKLQYSPIGLVRLMFGRAGIQLTMTQLLLVYVVSFLLSLAILQLLKGLLSQVLWIPVLLVLTLVIPIFIGYLLAIRQRVAFRDGLIQWMHDGASESSIERNFYRLTERVAMKSRNSHTRREMNLVLRESMSRKMPLADVMMERAKLWNMPTYKMIAVFSKVLVESGGSVREAFMAIRDSLERQKMKEYRIKKKTVTNRIGSYLISVSFLIGLALGYNPLKSILDKNPITKVEYYLMFVDCIGVIIWLLWYTRKTPK